MNVSTTYPGQDLLARIAQGDEQAYTAFFGEYHPKLYHYIHQLTHSKEVAEELVLDVFLKLWQGRDVITEIQNIDGFLFRIAYNKSIDFLRSAKSKPRLAELAFENIQVPSTDDPSLKLVHEEYERVLREAIGLMPAQRQKVYRMHTEESKPYKQIAEELSISPNTVNMHVYEARRFIRQYVLKHLELGMLLLLLKE